MSVDAAFQQLRRANPEPDPTSLRRQLQDKSTLTSTIARRSDIMAPRTPTIEKPQSKPSRRWAPALVAGLAVLLIGVPSFLTRDSGGIFGLFRQTSSTATASTTTAPPATTMSGSTTTAPTTTTASESVFTSPLYSYSIVLPAAWRPDPAVERWDGSVGGFDSDTANSDAFEGTILNNTLWAVAAPTTKGLNDFVSDQNAIDAIEHDCENPPDIDEPITLDDEPARLTAKNCPIGNKTLIASAAVIKDGVGYFFYFRNVDPDSSSLDVFRELLTGVTLP